MPVHSRGLKILSVSFALALLGCKERQFGDDDTEVKSIMNPHKLPDVGPWFEGWYMRITPTLGTDRSLGAIVGSYLPENSERVSAEEAGLSGYAALLDGGVIGGKLTSHESFPTDVRHYLNRSEIVDRDPMPSDRAAYRWASQAAGEFSAEHIELKIKKDIWLRARWSDIVPWSSNGLGPEGIISLFRAFPLHWFVYSLGSPVEFEAQLPDPVNPEKRNKIVGRGYAHLEKNWGVSFPESYVWMQGHDATAKKTIALAGGRPISIAGIKPEAWLVGFRSELFKQDFAPQNLGTVFTSQVDACLGKFSLTAAHLNRKIVVEANARRDSFGGISIPKKSGFQTDGSEQSFQAQIVARLYEAAPFGLGGAADRLIEQSIFKTGALEFGGSYKCQR